MLIELKPSSLGCDVRCAVCGQSFLLFSSRLPPLLHREVVAQVQRALREHHANRDDHNAHPAEAFSMHLSLEMLRPAA